MVPIHLETAFQALRRTLPVGLIGAAIALPLLGTTFDPSQTPATPVPPERYPAGGLEPLVILGDTTYFNVNNSEPTTQPYYHDLDAEGSAAAGYFLFAATGRGLEIWDISDDSTPVLEAFAYGQTTMPHWGHSDTNFFLKGVDAPAGRHDVLAMGATGQGFVVWNTSNKSNPRVHYQDNGVQIEQVWSFTAASGTMYTIGADQANSADGGLKLYDLTRAQSFNGCLESSGGTPVCTLVYRGPIGDNKRTTAVHGVTTASGKSFAATRWQVGPSYRVEIWDVTNPLSTIIPGTLPRLSATFPSGFRAIQLAMWEEGGTIYLGALGSNEVRVFNVDCVDGAGACSLGTPVATIPVPGEAGIDQLELSFGRAGGDPFLYVGNQSAGLTCLPQREYVLDMSLPINPATADVTPDPITDVSHPDGPLLGYWGWYYCPCSTGFNFVRPQRAAFHPNPSKKVVYRAAFALLDSHKITGAGVPQPPTADFTWSPSPVFEGQPIDFADQSTGTPPPDQWSWTFEDGAPGTSSAQDPQNVTFSLDNSSAASESKTVTLVATSSAGSSPTASKEVVVLNPRPAIASVTPNVTSALECSQISFTANGVTGNPSPSLAWEVKRVPAGTVVDTGGNVNPFTWDIDPGETGTFAATATATNSAGSNSRTSQNVTVTSLPTLAFTGPGNAPTVVSNSGGTVVFNIQAAGATEWNWNFGDGTSTGWISDPVTGPSPTHVYTSTDTYSVTVQIRNCNAGPITSNAVDVLVEVEPLGILSFGANCLGAVCFLSTGESVIITHTIQGSPDTYEYDWNGDGIYEDVRGAAATNHVFCSSGNPSPMLKVRRGAEPTVALSNSKLFSVTGASSCNPPAAPGGLAVAQSGSNLDLTWGNVANETEYRILRSVDGTNFNFLDSVGVNTLAYTDTGAIEGVTYTYKVQAFAAPGGSTSGAGGFSNTAQGTVTNPAIFTDGFESGNTSAWSKTVTGGLGSGE